MANKTVVWTISGLVGETGLTLLLFAEGGNSIVNGAGDSLTNSAYGRLTCTVTEALAGWYDAVIIDASSNIVTERGPDAKVYFIGDIAGTYVVGNNVTITQYQADLLYFQPVVRSVDDDKAISFLWPLSGRSFSSSTKVIDQGSSSAITGAITELGGVGNKYEYSIAYNVADRPTEEGTVRYTLTDGTNTRYLTLRIEKAIASAEVAAALFPYLQGNLAIYNGPSGEDCPKDIVITADLDYSVPLVLPSTSAIQYFIRATRNATDALLVATKAIGLTQLRDNFSPTANQATITWAADSVAIHVDAVAVKELPLGSAWAEIREITVGGATKSKHEIELILRHSAGRVL